tara:strand:- start:545 stop:706 length:162 start_codon:yes stop_codon:yes gene_type:complete
MKLNISQKRLKQLIKEEVETFVENLNNKDVLEVDADLLQDLISKELAKPSREE